MPASQLVSWLDFGTSIINNYLTHNTPILTFNISQVLVMVKHRLYKLNKVYKHA